MARDGIRGAGDRGHASWQYHADEQRLPQPDSRHRVNASVLFYIATLECGTAGCTLLINEGAERVRHSSHGQPEVVFESVHYKVRPAATFDGFIDEFRSRGCGVYVGGVEATRGVKIDPAPYIYIVTRENYAKLRDYHPKRL